MTSFDSLLGQVRACTLCAQHLAHGVRPVLQINPNARILIAGQAPGKKVHQSGVPFDDASGDRLRDWLGISRETFYNEQQIAILPMGFCYPGSGKSGDLPPRTECAAKWRELLLSQLENIELTLLIGKYAQTYHLCDKQTSLTETVKAWENYWPTIAVLPHPSPRNNIWLKRNPWFEQQVLPALAKRVAQVLET
jgi:uracil-DNA glycosylase